MLQPGNIPLETLQKILVNFDSDSQASLQTGWALNDCSLRINRNKWTASW